MLMLCQENNVYNQMLKKQQIKVRTYCPNHPQRYFQPVYRSKVNYQREKSELIHEILRTYNHKEEGIDDGRNGEKRQVSFVTSLPLKQMQEIDVKVGEKVEDQSEEESYEYKAIITPTKQQLDQTIKNIVTQEENIQYLSDYIDNLKKTKATNRAEELKDCMYAQAEEYIIIDSFIKTRTQLKNEVVGNEQEGYSYIHNKAYQKSKESKMFLSQFYKDDRTSHRAIRKTESFVYSKGKVAKQPSQSDSVPKTPKKYQISHEIKRPKEAIINQQTTSKERSVCTHNEKYDDLNSLKKVTHQPRVEKSKKQSSISQFVSHNFEERKRRQPYNYDEEDNIFNTIEQKQSIKGLLNKDYTKQIKEIFRVRDEERFRNEVKQEGQRFQQKKKIVIKRNKEELFTGNEELNIKRHLQAVEKQKKEKEKEQAKVEVPSIQSVQWSNQQAKEETVKKDNCKSEPQKQQTQSIVRPIKAKELEQVSMLQHLSNACSQSSATVNEIAAVSQKPIEIPQQILSSTTTPIKIIERIKKQQSKKAQTAVSQKRSFIKIFGMKDQQKVQQPQNLSQIFFANNKVSEQQMASRPSTVHNIQEEERSDDRIDIIGQIRSLKENQHDLDDFDPNKKQELQGGIHHQIQHNGQQEIMMSADAISFSKLASATIQDYSNTELKSSLQSIIERSITQPKILNNAQPVKRIEIQLDPLSSDEDQDGQLHYESSQEGGQVDLDQLDDYDSDEQPNHNQAIRPNFPAVLAPVIEEDLEETQFKRSKALQSIIPNSSIKRPSNSIDADQLKKLQQEFLKGINLKNEKSDVLELKPSKSSDLFRISKSKSKIEKPLNEDISIDARLSDKHFEQSISYVERYSSLSHDSTQKELINSIRHDISNLKSKIQSSFISEDRQAVVVKKQTSKPSVKKQSQGSISKFFNDHSISMEKHDLSEVQPIQHHSSIDFDKLNQEQLTLYSDVKKQFTTLKKKMEKDAKMS